MTIKVSIEGYGEYQIDSSKLKDLISWLKNNQLPITEVIKNNHQHLIYE